MGIHLIKLAVGIDSVEHLCAVQRQKRRQTAISGKGGRLRHITRNMPRRAHEILEDGSLYWVIRGRVQARQRIVAIETITGLDRVDRCALILDSSLVTTIPLRMRAFQGWRYLSKFDAPPDLGGSTHSLPDTIVAELQELGLL